VWTTHTLTTIGNLAQEYAVSMAMQAMSFNKERLGKNCRVRKKISFSSMGLKSQRMIQ
jgi:hypothetical protein